MSHKLLSGDKHLRLEAKSPNLRIKNKQVTLTVLKGVSVKLLFKRKNNSSVLLLGSPFSSPLMRISQVPEDSLRL